MGAAEFGADPVPGGGGGAFGDADQQQGEPAQQHVGADAVLQAVEDRPQLQDRFEITESAFCFQTSPHYRAEMTVHFTIWDQITGVTGHPAAA
ncbi:hypothetical protein [Streptomyces sp. NPDC057909]|uniref:hypothetical protein n=1 Tax=Streptomyces sp. NPDC057909 TaxID=3346277 RepID=UPI0036E3B449